MAPGLEARVSKDAPCVGDVPRDCCSSGGVVHQARGVTLFLAQVLRGGVALGIGEGSEEVGDQAKGSHCGNHVDGRQLRLAGQVRVPAETRDVSCSCCMCWVAGFSACEVDEGLPSS